MSARVDTVLSVLDWWDGPLAGAATFHGATHRFRRIEQIRSDRAYKGVYELTPLSADIAALEAERWAIWSRWRAAWKAVETSHATWPALPADAERRKQIEALLAVTKLDEPIRCRGAFTGTNEELHTCAPSTSVRWTRTGRKSHG